ncbi:DUF4283 domain protein, partial [Trifolium medium]|nr:DUF4283 domain protein [Trifolium medium]
IRSVMDDVSDNENVITKQTVVAATSGGPQGDNVRNTMFSAPIPKRGKRNLSCPLGGEHSIVSGPWSREWLDDHNHRDAGIIFSTKKKLKKSSKPSAGHSKETVKIPRKKKAGGVLRHIMQNLKKVARLPGRDRKEVLKILEKEVKRRSGRSRSHKSVEVVNQVSSNSGSSAASINKDWEHWVVMHGNEKVAVEDVMRICFRCCPERGEGGLWRIRGWREREWGGMVRAVSVE